MSWAPAARQTSKVRSLKASTDGKIRRSMTCTGSPAFAARSTPAALRWVETTSTMRTGSVPAAIRLIRFCRVVPPPLMRTAIGNWGTVWLSDIRNLNSEFGREVLEQVPRPVRNRNPSLLSRLAHPSFRVAGQRNLVHARRTRGVAHVFRKAADRLQEVLAAAKCLDIPEDKDDCVASA